MTQPPARYLIAGLGSIGLRHLANLRQPRLQAHIGVLRLHNPPALHYSLPLKVRTLCYKIPTFENAALPLIRKRAAAVALPPPGSGFLPAHI